MLKPIHFCMHSTDVGSYVVQGGAVNCGLKRFFSLYRPLHLIEAYVWPEKYWLVWAGPLANHPFNFNFIFLSNGGGGKSDMFCGSIPPLAGVIPQRRKDVGPPNLREA
jgi:hypothetical protein